MSVQYDMYDCAYDSVPPESVYGSRPGSRHPKLEVDDDPARHYPTPSISPPANPYHPFRSPPCVYWYYPYPLGHEPVEDIKEGESRYAQLTAELQPHLAGGRIDILTLLQVLDELIIPCALYFSQQAMFVWMQHLQEAITAVKLYSFAFALTRYEKDLIMNFALYWSQKRGGACDMGRPETQIVLSMLLEMAQC